MRVVRRDRAGRWYLFLLGGVGFLTAFGAHAVVVNLPEYGRRYGLSYAALGLLLAAYNLAEIVVKPPAGRLADRAGPRVVMLWGTVLFSLSCLAYLVLPPITLAGLRVCQGLGAGALSVASMVLVVRGYSRRLGGAFGIYNALKGSGYVLAPLAGGFLGGGLRGALLFAGLAGTAVLCLLVATGSPPAVRCGGKRPAPLPARLWPWYLANFTDTALLGLVLGFLPVRADELGYGAKEIGLLLTGLTLSYLAVQPAAGVLADRVGRRPLVFGGLALASAATAVLGVFRGAGLALAAVLAGLGLGVTWTNSLAAVGEAAGGEAAGDRLGLAGSCKDAGDIAGPMLFGLIAGRWGISAAFGLCGTLGLAVLGIIASGTGTGGQPAP
ncbi:MAG: MFS transporter [Bacteroidota bacterium]